MRKVSKLLTIGIALCAAALFMPQHASAAVRSQDCPNGYLVGFNTIRGVWVDRIGAICRPWTTITESLGTDHDQPLLATSNGGSPERVECPDGFAIVELDQSLPTIDGQNVAEFVTLTCQNVKWPHNGSTVHPKVHTTGSGRNDNDPACLGVCATGTGVPVAGCDTGQIATGFDANVGEFVGRIRLHCGDWPKQPSLSQQSPSQALRHRPSGNDVARFFGNNSTGGGSGSGSGPPATYGFPGSWNVSASNGAHFTMTMSMSGGLVVGPTTRRASTARSGTATSAAPRSRSR